MTSSESQLIHSFVKTKGQEVRLALKRYNEQYWLDLRVWYQPEKSPDFRPTQKGVCLALNQLSELRIGLERLTKAAERLPDLEGAKT